MRGVESCRLIELPRIQRREGQITPVVGGVDVPFDIARIYYLYDVPGGATRGGHAHKSLQQLMVSVMGSFDVKLDDGRHTRVVTLNRAYQGLLIPRMIWRDLSNFSSGGICMVLASLPYAEDDYIREYDEFLECARGA
jgi:dTDP-4-dehydrorhamnose 3,5-epimerase-like enzyme